MIYLVQIYFGERFRMKKIICNVTFLSLIFILISGLSFSMTRSELTDLIREKKRQDESLRNLDLSHMDLSGMEFSGLDIQNVDFSNSNLTNSKFEKMKIEGGIFTKANIDGSLFQFVEVVECKFFNTSATGVRFLVSGIEESSFKNMSFIKSKLQSGVISRSTFDNVEFKNTEFEELGIENITLNKVDFNTLSIIHVEMENVFSEELTIENSTFLESYIKNSNLTLPIFTHTKFLDSEIRHSVFQHLVIDHSDFSHSDIFASNLEGASIDQSIFEKSKFLFSDFESTVIKNSRLDYAQFDHADLSHSRVSESSMKGGNFYDASMYKAKFRDVDLSEAIFKNTDMREADLTGSSIKKTIFKDPWINGVTWVDGTKDVKMLSKELGVEKISRGINYHLRYGKDIKDIWLFFSGTILLIFGLAPFYLMSDLKKSVLYEFSLLLCNIAVLAFALTEFSMMLLGNDILWGIIILLLGSFIVSNLALFINHVFCTTPQYFLLRLKRCHVWGALGVLGLGIFIVLVLDDSNHVTGIMEIIFFVVLGFLLLIYLATPIWTLIRGVFQKNIDCIAMSAAIGMTILTCVPFILWTFNLIDYQRGIAILPIAGGVIFILSPIGIVLRRFILINNNLVKTSETLKQQTVELENKNGELKKINELKDEFLANTSHELRTPLNGIIGIADSLVDIPGVKCDSVLSSNLSMIISSGKRLAALVNDILDFSKLQHNKLELSLKPIDMKALTDLSVVLLKPLYQAKKLDMINLIPGGEVSALADENRVQQILYNLLGNAIKFTKEGQIKISAERRGDYLAVHVSDSGIGIPKEKFDKIFQSFEQADGSTAREFGGTGIGLAITKKLVELHGGEIFVESVVGRGSTFTFTLPVSDQKANFSEVESAVNKIEYLPEIDQLEDIGQFSHTGRCSKILIVDDEPVNLQVLVNHLTHNNYNVLKANDAYEAIEILKCDTDIDLILLDIMMPRMTGYELCSIIRKERSASELPIVMLTAKNRVNDLVEGFDSGANDYLTKPVVKGELMARVNSHILLTRISKAAKRFVPLEFLDIFNKSSIADIELGENTQKEMTILFSDIRSFTSISEKMTPQENFDFINSYLSVMGPLVRQHGGFIDKYIGDGIMALFDCSPEKSIDSALAMLEGLEEFNKLQAAKGYDPIRIGIGINTGNLMLGTLGETHRMDSTAISDAVNLTSRIEGLTKKYHEEILITEGTKKRLSDSAHYQITYVDNVQVKGKEKWVKVYSVKK